MTRKIDPGSGREITGQIVIKCWSDGALSVEGPTGDPWWCLAVLENAKDAIKNQQRRKGDRPVIIPAHDVDIIPSILPSIPPPVK
jgi:hypothetical protein